MDAVHVKALIDALSPVRAIQRNPLQNPGLQRQNPKLFWLETLATTDQLIDEFRLLKTDRERFTHAFKAVLRFDSSLWFDLRCKQKISTRSIRLHKDGNQLFAGGQYKEAVKKYTESIVYAIDSSEELALAYADRSAALYNLEKYEDCIKDVNRALNLEIPEKSKTGLYKRKGLCLRALGSPSFAASFQEALVYLNKLTLSEEQNYQTRKELGELISLPITQPMANVVQYPVPKILTPNPEIPCASDAVSIKYSKKFGRHLVANRRIKPGDLLILEKPYCSKLEDENIYTHCSHCLQESWSLIPCKCCVYVAYCSEACKDEAWDEYHEVECPVVGHLADYKFKSVLWIGLKTVIMATQKGTKLDSLKEELKTVDCNPDPRTKGFGDDGKFLSSQYRSVYSLSNSADMYSSIVVLERSIWVALTVCMIARETNMFGKKMTLDYCTLPTNPDIIFVGELILKHLFIGFSNMFSYGSVSGDLSTEYAGGVVPVCSLLNHSCDTNTLRQWYVDCQAVYAILPIEQGEQIFDNYGARVCTMSKDERRQTLDNWKFTCDCPPCTEDWPNIWDMPSYKQKPLSRRDKVKLDRIMRKLGSTCNSVLQKSSLQKLTYLLNELLKAIQALFDLARKPCKELYTVVLVVQMFHWSGDAIFDYVPGRSASEITYAPAQFYRRLRRLSDMIYG